MIESRRNRRCRHSVLGELVEFFLLFSASICRQESAMVSSVAGSCLPPCSVFEEHAAVDSAVLGADTLLALWSRSSRWAGRSRLSIGAWWSIGSGWSFGTRWSGLAVFSWLSGGTGWAGWSGISGLSWLSGSGGLADCWGSGIARGSSWSSLSGWSGGSLRARFAGWCVGSWFASIAGRSWVTSRSWWAGWAGWSLWARLAWWRRDWLAWGGWRLSGGARKTRGAGFAVLARLASTTGWAWRSWQTATVAASSADAWAGVDNGSVAVSFGLTTSAVVGTAFSGNSLQMVHLRPDVFGGALAEGHLVMHLSAHMVNVVVDHRQGDADGKHCDNGEGDRRVGDKLVRLDAPVDFHGDGLSGPTAD